MKYEWSFGASTFKRRLILLMEEKGLSQQAVADFSGVSQGTVSRWLSGSRPELENVTSLASKTGVAVSWLAHGEGSLKIAYGGIDGFIHRAKTKVIPRINDVIKSLNELEASDFLPAHEQTIIEDVHHSLGSRRTRLSMCIEALEKLPPDEGEAVLQILSRHYVPMPSEQVRGEICIALGLRGMSSDDEILEACRAVLKKNPVPKFGGKRSKSSKRASKK